MSLIVEHRCDAGAGQWLENAAASPAHATNPNLFGTGERFTHGDGWSINNVTVTDDVSDVDFNDGSGNPAASTFVGGGTSSDFVRRNVTLAAGQQYTISVKIKSLSGAQTVRLIVDDGSDTHTSSNLAVTTSVATISFTFTAANAGQYSAGLWANSGGSAMNVRVGALQIVAGASAGTYQAPDFSGVFGRSNSPNTAAPAFGADGITFSGANQAITCLGRAAVSLSEATVYAAVAFTAAGTLVSSGSPSDTRNDLFLSSKFGSPDLPTAGFGGVQVRATLATLLDGLPHILALRADGSTLSLWMDDVAILETAYAPSLPQALRAFTLGHDFSNNGSLEGTVYYHALYDTAHDEATRLAATAAIRAILIGRSITPTQPSAVLIAEGDSITNGGEITRDVAYPSVGARALTPMLHGRNFAVAGNTLADLVARQTDVIAAIQAIPDAVDTIIVSCMVGANSMGSLNDLTARQAEVDAETAYLQDFLDCDPRVKVIWITNTPSIDDGIPAWNTNRNALNVLRRADPFVDNVRVFLWDAGDTGTTMGADAAPDDASLYNPDNKIHPTALGASLLGADFAAVLETVLASSPAGAGTSMYAGWQAATLLAGMG